MAKVIGVDFGTSRSYFCGSPTDAVKPQDIDFGFGPRRPGLATAILYREGQRPLIGDVALEEWGEMSPADRLSCRLRTQFKPHIAASPEARQDAVVFLSGALSHLRRVHGEDNLQFVFGIPGEADANYRSTLQEVAREAGYGDVMIECEPFGAVYWHLDLRDIGLDQAEDGILVVDFGGGTCDFAYMRHLRIQHFWGCMSFGGRLFDDLFFQWFLDENAGVLDALAQNGDEYFVHWHLCQQAKERFSRVMTQDRYGTVTKKIGTHGSMRSMTWGQFLIRAQQYRPSNQFSELLRQCGEPAGESTESVNLLEQLRNLLEKGLDDIRPASVERVILTGGSSQWPFVREIVCNALGIDASNVILGADPNKTIGAGLAIHPALMESYRKRAANLRREMPGVLSGRIDPIIDHWVSKTVDVMCDDVTLQLYDARVKPLLRTLATDGVSVAAVQDEIDQQIEAFEPAMKDIVTRHATELNKVLPYKVRNEVVEWLTEAGLPYSEPRIGKLGVPDVTVPLPGIRVPNVWFICLCILIPLLSVTFAWWGWERGGGLAGGLLAIPILGVLRLWMSDWIRAWPVPKELPVIHRKIAVGRWFFSDERIHRMLKKAKARLHMQLSTKIGKAAEDPKQKCAEALVRLVDQIERIVDK